MSSRRTIEVIARKELSEMLRERKTIILMVVLPVALYPLLFGSLSAVTLYNQSVIEAETQVLAACGDALPGDLTGRLDDGLHVVPCADVARPHLRVEYVAAQGGAERASLRVEYDGSSEAARAALSKLKEGLKGWSSNYERARLESVGLVPEDIQPAVMEIANTAPPARQGGWILGQILPMLVSLLMIGASFHPAVDMTAGERERGTFETLMTAPVSPIELVTGKFIAVLVLTVANGLVNVGAIALMAWMVPIPDAVADNVSFAVPLLNGALVLLAMVCLGMMFGALALAVSVTTTTLKEAQGYWTPVYLVCILPLIASTIPGVVLTPQTAAIPVLNLALAMKSLLLGDVAVWLLAEVVITTLLWTLLGLIAAARLFASEEILMGSEGVSAVFRRRQEGAWASARPVVPEAFLLFSVVMLALFYGGLLAASVHPLVAVHISQWIGLLAPTCALVWWLRLSPRETLALRRPAWMFLLLAAVIGLNLWIPVGWLMENLILEHLPEPNEELQRFVEELMALGEAPGTAALLLVSLSLVPALCEEVVFRGFILQALAARGSKHGAVWLSALLFAIVHMNPLQFPTTFLLGGVLGYLTLASRSVLPAILLHTLHNGAVVAFQLWGEGVILPPSTYLISSGLCAVSLISLSRR